MGHSILLSASFTHKARPHNTAPANGYFALKKDTNSANQYLNIGTNALQWNTNAFGDGQHYAVFIPVRKGDELRVQYSFGGSNTEFRFIYSEGS